MSIKMGPMTLHQGSHSEWSGVESIVLSWTSSYHCVTDSPKNSNDLQFQGSEEIVGYLTNLERVAIWGWFPIHSPWFQVSVVVSLWFVKDLYLWRICIEDQWHYGCITRGPWMNCRHFMLQEIGAGTSRKPHISRGDRLGISHWGIYDLLVKSRITNWVLSHHYHYYIVFIYVYIIIICHRFFT